MTGQPSPADTVKTLPIICVAFLVTIVLMMIFIQQERNLESTTQNVEVFTMAGFALLLVGMALAQTKLRPRNDGSKFKDIPPSKFLIDMVVALAQIWGCALLGVFIVKDKLMSTVMPVASIVAIALFVLTSVLQYIKAVKGE